MGLHETETGNRCYVTIQKEYNDCGEIGYAMMESTRGRAFSDFDLEY